MITAETQDRIQAALQVQDFELAGVLSETALANGEAHETLFRLAALRRQVAGDLTGAADMLLSASQLSPDDPAILTAAADALRQIGQLQHAVVLFDDALAHDGAMVAAWYGRALVLEAAGSLEKAQQNYKRVTELAPGTAPGFAGLATTSAALGHSDDARRYATQAYDLAPNDPAACMALARCEMTDGNFARAVAVLRTTALDQVELLTLLGDALDRLGNFEDAFDAYAKANQRVAQMHQMSDEAPRPRDCIDAMEQAITSLRPGAWKATLGRASSDAVRHIFLLGFPRSGTTLVEQALASLPDVVTLEEMPTLEDASDLLTGDGILRLATLPENEMDSLQAAYWRRVADSGIDVAGKTFVDMDPSKSSGLPVIARLFPEAKIIIMRRDPRDVVWSCFRRAFVRNAVTLEFTSLDRTAIHYASIMRLIRASTDTLTLDAHSIVYEELVRDFDATTRDLCRFIDVPWSAVMRDFATTARLGRVKTASAVQVRGALFDGAGQWRNYADKLEPVMPILEPWIDRN
jgi:tetratricopeptide (TPR) repeat protein